MSYTTCYHVVTKFVQLLIVVLEFCDGLTILENVPVSTSNSKEEYLQELSDRFCGCRVVDQSINIFDRPLDQIYNSADFEFLSGVEEIGDTLFIRNINVADNITIPNLRLIRGRNLVDFLLSPAGSVALFIQNTTAPLYLPKLTEITIGDVYIVTVSSCNHRGVLWEDILTDSISQYQDIGNDHCASKSSLYITVYGVMIFSFRQYRHNY